MTRMQAEILEQVEAISVYGTSIKIHAHEDTIEALCSDADLFNTVWGDVIQTPWCDMTVVREEKYPRGAIRLSALYEFKP